MSMLRFLRENARWLFAGVLIAYLSSFGQTFVISVFAGDIRAEFGLSNGQWGGLYSLATVISATLMLWAGALTDRFRVRGLGIAVLSGLALACVAMAVVPGPMALVPVIFALRFFGQGMAVQCTMVAMARWFVANRGRALAVATLGFSLGELSLPLSIAGLLPHVGWRSLWLVCAGIILLGLPFIARLLKSERTPQSMATENPSPGMGGRHWSRGEVLRHPLFWLSVPALMGAPIFVTTIFFNQVDLAQAKGWAHVALVALFPFYTATGICGTFGAGAVIDRTGTGRLMPVYLLPLAAGLLLLSQAQGLVPMALSFALIGISQGANGPLTSAFWAEFYGTRHLGANRAMGGALMVLGSALGPGIAGALMDAGIPLERQLMAFSGLVVVSSLLVGLGIAGARRQALAAA